MLRGIGRPGGMLAAASVPDLAEIMKAGTARARPGAASGRPEQQLRDLWAEVVSQTFSQARAGHQPGIGNRPIPSRERSRFPTCRRFAARWSTSRPIGERIAHARACCSNSRPANRPGKRRSIAWQLTSTRVAAIAARAIGRDRQAAFEPSLKRSIAAKPQRRRARASWLALGHGDR